jgi:nucleotide-binding universal stress UspA family protein
MLPIQKILCPTDFSKPSLQAMSIAGEMAAHFGARLDILHVVEDVPSMPATRIGAPVTSRHGESVGERRNSSEDEIKKAASREIPDEVHFNPIILQGDPADSILEFAAREKPGMIVIAIHSMSGLEKALFGSVAEEVIKKAPCPVLSVRPAL